MGQRLVFSGPSLTRADRDRHADLVFLPPAAQGDMVAAADRYAPAAMLLIDGVFQSQPAVRHKEILWAVSQGIAVIGAASMGALRAAELAPHMQGVGLIYRWYRCCNLAPDDAVAILHGPAELDFAPLTDALIDIRMVARTARRRGLTTADEARRLERCAAGMNFRDRTFGAALALLPEGERQRLAGALAAAMFSQKRLDALAALAVLRAGRYLQPAPATVFEITRAFLQDLYDSGLSSAAGGMAQRGSDV